VPWHVVQTPKHDEVRIGYHWLWIGPTEGEFFDENATPDLSIIGLRLLAATAIATAAFLLAANWRAGQQH